MPPNIPCKNQKGITLLELLITVAIASVLIAAISGVVNTALDAGQSTHLQNDTLQQARFAMQRMSRVIRKSRELRLPPGRKHDNRMERIGT